MQELVDAIINGDIALVVKILNSPYCRLDLSTALTLKGEEGNTLVLIAARYGQVEILKLLAEKNVWLWDDMESGKFNGLSALSLAIIRSHVPTIEYLLKSKFPADVTIKSGPQKDLTHMHLAASLGLTDSMVCLMLHGANFTAPLLAGRMQGMTPLALATLEGHVDTVKMLISYGAAFRQPMQSGMFINKNPQLIAEKITDPKLRKKIVAVLNHESQLEAETIQHLKALTSTMLCEYEDTSGTVILIMDTTLIQTRAFTAFAASYDINFKKLAQYPNKIFLNKLYIYELCNLIDKDIERYNYFIELYRRLDEFLSATFLFHSYEEDIIKIICLDSAKHVYMPLLELMNQNYLRGHDDEYYISFKTMLKLQPVAFNAMMDDIRIAQLRHFEQAPEKIKFELSEFIYKLVHAAANGDTYTLSLMLDNNDIKANLDTFMTEGKYKYFNPLFSAVYYGHLEAVSLLISHGANYTSPLPSGPLKGGRPLDLAISNKHRDIMTLLVQCNVDTECSKFLKGDDLNFCKSLHREEAGRTKAVLDFFDSIKSRNSNEAACKLLAYQGYSMVAFSVNCAERQALRLFAINHGAQLIVSKTGNTIYLRKSTARQLYQQMTKAGEWAVLRGQVTQLTDIMLNLFKMVMTDNTLINNHHSITLKPTFLNYAFIRDILVELSAEKTGEQEYCIHLSLINLERLCLHDWAASRAKLETMRAKYNQFISVTTEYGRTKKPSYLTNEISIVVNHVAFIAEILKAKPDCRYEDGKLYCRYKDIFTLPENVLTHREVPLEKQIEKINRRDELKKVLGKLIPESLWEEQDGILSCQQVNPCVLANLREVPLPGLKIVDNHVSVHLNELNQMNATEFSAYSERINDNINKLAIIDEIICFSKVGAEGKQRFKADGIVFLMKADNGLKQCFQSCFLGKLEEYANEELANRHLIRYATIFILDKDKLNHIQEKFNAHKQELVKAVLAKTKKEDAHQAKPIKLKQVKVVTSSTSLAKKIVKKTNKQSKQVPTSTKTSAAKAAPEVLRAPKQNRVLDISHLASAPGITSAERVLIQQHQIESPSLYANDNNQKVPAPAIEMPPVDPVNAYDGSMLHELQFLLMTDELRKEPLTDECGIEAINLSNWLSMIRLFNAIFLRNRTFQISKDGDQLAGEIRQRIIHEFPTATNIQRFFTRLVNDDIITAANRVTNHKQPKRPIILVGFELTLFAKIEGDLPEQHQSIADRINQTFQQLCRFHDEYHQLAMNAGSNRKIKTMITAMEACIVKLGELRSKLDEAGDVNIAIKQFLINQCREFRNVASHVAVYDKEAGYHPMSEDTILAKAKYAADILAKKPGLHN